MINIKKKPFFISSDFILLSAKSSAEWKSFDGVLQNIFDIVISFKVSFLVLSSLKNSRSNVGNLEWLSFSFKFCEAGDNDDGSFDVNDEEFGELAQFSWFKQKVDSLTFEDAAAAAAARLFNAARISLKI